ncbi:branched-chain amino acid ABC transporter permease [Deinococcus cellulosilyticus]|uniref:Branched-chain amino acid ABC transporter permease n=1 Tax=Deinococcus cellulosilyticus (strain DSM 18568 / NBRC 106333 / KACC 11606 / 5516J-15) TaxID=1223518 RepID=A0A511N2W4_DEIC1|nr:branched-chain amino acid ABC transporter permease [Deinococcus cellulosilyticus]GEM46847.1 branched-chain amino acid ABC transporter permease [Deinococcus cellulosilyticus NBRC 106333 = KACC 11606]
MEIFSQGMQALIDGLLTGGVYAMIGAGLSLIFGVMRIINFGHGDFVVLGMYSAFFAATALHMDPYLSILVVAPLAYLLGFAVHRLILSRLLGASEQSTKLASLGIGLVVSNAILLGFGTQPQTVDTTYSTSVWVMQVGTLELRFSVIRVVAMVITAALIFLLNRMLFTSEIGKAIRATGQNRLGAELQGVDTRRIYAVIFGIGTVLAATAGVLLLPLLSATPTMGTIFTNKAFVITILGGLGSMPGAIIGGLILGVVESLGSSIFPLIPFLNNHFGSNYRDAYGLIIFLLVLLLKPEGLFGRTVKRV